MEIRNTNEGKNIIEEVTAGSIGEELGVEPGDILLSINDQVVKDIIDYKYLINDEYLVIAIEKKDGEIWELEIEKDYDEDIGISFTNPLIDKAKSCRNKCVFCFIDQLPKGMRKTLYFKDDDSRLSFLQGNFITLTNLNDDEINRIIQYRISPINISVHTTNPELRIKMLNNKNASKINDILKRFSEAGIIMNCQIVLVPGVNDGENLKRTIKDLYNLYPRVESVAVVPVGVTKHREGLHDLEIFSEVTANRVIDDLSLLQENFLKKSKTRFVFPSDEFYILAKKSLPLYDTYEGFPQLENGVGLLRLFNDQVEGALHTLNNTFEVDRSYVVATGELAYQFIKDVCAKIEAKFENLTLNVVAIKNKFFGDTITVSGLVTASDIINQLETYKFKDGLIIPKSMLKADETVFLDDLTVEELSQRLNTKIFVGEVNGTKFVEFFQKNKR